MDHIRYKNLIYDTQIILNKQYNLCVEITDQWFWKKMNRYKMAKMTFYSK